MKINRTEKISGTIEIPGTIPELESEKIIIKPLSFNELVISVERLTRFQYPYQKDDRVYKEIITKHTIHPKISLKNYYDYSLGTIKNLVQLIWNISVEMTGEVNLPDYAINTYLTYEDLKAFSANTLIKDILSSENILYSRYYDLVSGNDSVITRDINGENKLINILNENGFNISKNGKSIQELDIFSQIYFQYNLNFPINIDGLLNLIEKKNIEASSNIQRLIWLNKICKKEKLSLDNKNFLEIINGIYEKAEKHREKYSAKYPSKLLILVEGATEEKLLPIFASKLGMNFDKEGIQLIAAGGKNQVARIYKKYYQKLNLPIFILLDSDAEEIAKEIEKILRKKDKIYVIQEGEFEDILPIELICKSINAYHGLTARVTLNEIRQDCYPMVTCLGNLWKEKGLGEFDKVKFAKIVAENINEEKDISSILRQIVKIISRLVDN